MKQVLSLLIPVFLITQVAIGQTAPNPADYPEGTETRYLEAERAYGERDYAKARRLYEQLTAEFPNLPPGHAGLAATLIQQGDYLRAVESLKRALAIVPDEPMLMAALGDAYRRDKQYDDAETWYLKTVQAETDDRESVSRAYVGLGILESFRGNYEKSRQYLTTAVQRTASSEVAVYNLGSTLLRLNRLDEADACFRKAFELNRRNALALFGRGQVASKKGNLFAARDWLTRATELDPSDPAIHYARAQILLRLGDKASAEKALANHRRTKSQAYLRETRQYEANNQWREALARVQKAVEADLSYVSAKLERAYIKLRMGELDSAKAEAQEILNANESVHRARFFLGVIAIEQKDYDTAETHLTELLRREPTYADAYPELSRLRELRGDFEGAVAAYGLGIRQFPQWAQGYWRRGQLYEGHGDIALAEADYRKAVELAPNIPYPVHSLARLLYQTNRSMEEAFALAQKAAELDSSPEHRATLALILHRLGRTPEARALIEQVLEDAPEHPDALSAFKVISSEVK